MLLLPFFKKLQTSGVNFTNILQAALTKADPKRAKKLSSHQSLFALLGFSRAKAACKMLVKSAPGICYKKGN